MASEGPAPSATSFSTLSTPPPQAGQSVFTRAPTFIIAWFIGRQMHFVRNAFLQRMAMAAGYIYYRLTFAEDCPIHELEFVDILI